MIKLKWVTQAIAQPCEIQKGLFPDFVNVADELAIEWELALERIFDHKLNEEQKKAIKQLDDYMLSISGATNVKYWNNEALCNTVEWNKMREMARAILIVMDWEITIPPKNYYIYIKGH